ncbi:MAG: hypothetical protein ACM3UW_01820 [Bacillota bacterium]
MAIGWKSGVMLLKGRKVSFIVSDPDIIRLLEAKKESKEMGVYINEALRYYYTHEINSAIETLQELAKTIQMLVETRDALLSGGEITLKKEAVKDESEELVDQMLANSIGSICDF